MNIMIDVVCKYRSGLLSGTLPLYQAVIWNWRGWLYAITCR